MLHCGRHLGITTRNLHCKRFVEVIPIVNEEIHSHSDELKQNVVSANHSMVPVLELLEYYWCILRVQ